MNNIKTKIAILAFLFILLAAPTLYTQNSDAGSDKLQSQSGELSDRSDTSDTQNQEGADDITQEEIDTSGSQDQETPDTNAEGGPESADTGSNESDLDSDQANVSSSVLSPEAITTAPSDLIPGNQSSNQTEEGSKPAATIERQLSSGLLSDLAIISPPPPYKVKVTFDSMTVHNDHEGALSGDGEYDIAAYVQGIKVGLTDASGPGDGLWDVSSGETVTFDPGTEVTVDIPPTMPLSIFTVGSEVDGCDRTAFPENVQSTIVSIIQKSPIGGIIAGVDAIRGVNEVQAHINGAINWIGCKLNPNDVLGVINQAYDPTGYGAGSHADKSNKGDFTLRYTISVTAPPPPQKEQTGLGTGKFLNQMEIGDKNDTVTAPLLKQPPKVLDPGVIR